MDHNINIERLNEFLILLKKDPVKNLSIIGFVENNKITGAIKSGESLCIRGISDHEWIYLGINELKDLCGIIELFDDSFKYFHR